jgi:pimeloyl-ACP methyl ester carboxylesterase
MPYTSHYLTCAGREIHFTEWGAGSAGTVIAWHGLARTGRDMDELAEHLSQRGWRVICPDTLGRGLSQWSPDPKHEYCLAFYARLACELLDQLASRPPIGSAPRWAAPSAWCARRAISSPRSRDAFAVCCSTTMRRELAPARHRSASSAYAGQPPAFDTVLELEMPSSGRCMQPYGWLSDAQWRHLTETSTRRLPDGRVTPHYDPAMVQQFTRPHQRLPDLGPLRRARHPGAVPARRRESDLVLPEIIAEMQRRGPACAGSCRWWRCRAAAMRPR